MIEIYILAETVSEISGERMFLESRSCNRGRRFEELNEISTTGECCLKLLDAIQPGFARGDENEYVNDEPFSQVLMEARNEPDFITLSTV